MPVIGWLSLVAPVEPWNLASPKAKIPPSDATIQQPDGDAAAAVPTAAARPSVAKAVPVNDPAMGSRPAARRIVVSDSLDRANIDNPPDLRFWRPPAAPPGSAGLLRSVGLRPTPAVS